MLTHLYIKNYILIEEVALSFSDGFTVITGETGAGKSVLIGAIAQLLGDRFDQKMMFDPQQKCVIEGTFETDSPELRQIFETNDLDFLPQTIIRREVTANGRSRTFVNDTPVSAAVLKEVGRFLVDIHSQHETLALQNHQFQLNVIDRFGKLEADVTALSQHFSAILQLKKQWNEKKTALEQMQREQEYRQFVMDELSQCRLQPDESRLLEQELQLLSQADELLQWSEKIRYGLTASDDPVVGLIEQLVSESRKFRVDDERVRSIETRLHQCAVELKDIANEAADFSDSFDSNPERMAQLTERLDTLNRLIYKYHVNSSDELLALLEQYQAASSSSEALQAETAALQQTIAQEEALWLAEARKISDRRTALFPDFERQITQLLQSLGMPEAQFRVALQTVAPCESGIDQISMLFSANRGMAPHDIKKGASGGEMSRIMLSIKYLISESLPLSTFIFDEIDTGISGSVATKVAKMLQKIAERKQIFTITHLPSIAATGEKHLFVYKQTDETKTAVSVRYLSDNERVEEIAQMIGGEKTEKSAVETAQHLLQER